ncbi:MAG: ABC-F family ATP-binding cassette domain-containing protein [Alphaproteobacteria bacterium]|nr:ABC-F family ATP-binding cassette domain-containing protein [Alphaproteobacteria bacterium]OJV13207.1 MAG: hypothetical protein BGO27_00180 [Alphaproteobacteria bacterium 33-17]
MSELIISLINTSFGYDNNPIFKDLSLYLYRGDKVCLVGKNGCGKSSLLKLLAKIHEMDSGEMHVRNGVNIGYLCQDAKIDSSKTIYEYVLEGYENLEETKYLADMVIANLGLKGNKTMEHLSGGKLRRVALAKTLVSQPDVLLLDEPTNHLDISAIEWLQSYINSNKELTVLCISHDREFLNAISNRIFWIDRGQFYIHNKGYSDLDNFMQQIFEQEEAKLRVMAKKMEAENHWLAYGVTARRKRNQRRLKDLFDLRNKLKAERARNKQLAVDMKLPALSSGQMSKLVLEFDDVTLGYNDVSPPKVIFKNFTARIMQGEKVGVVGRNGAGKTTLIKMILGDIEPLEGNFRKGVTVTISYADQHRKSIDLDKSLWENLCPEGGDHVNVNGTMLHVGSYLKRFLFKNDQFLAKASTLSGGELNRLLLAKALAIPGNLLILDEPTNDLDMDSLEMLEEMLTNYNGTVLIVSHDRAFLDDLVTRTIVISDDRIDDIIGGYSDYLRETSNKAQIKKEAAKKIEVKEEAKPKQQTKLSYKDQRDLDMIPSQIDELSTKILSLEEELSDPDLYAKHPDKYNQKSEELEKLKAEIDRLELRWLEVVEIQEGLK